MSNRKTKLTVLLFAVIFMIIAIIKVVFYTALETYVVAAILAALSIWLFLVVYLCDKTWERSWARTEKGIHSFLLKEWNLSHDPIHMATAIETCLVCIEEFQWNLIPPDILKVSEDTMQELKSIRDKISVYCSGYVSKDTADECLAKIKKYFEEELK